MSAETGSTQSRDQHLDLLRRPEEGAERWSAERWSTASTVDPQAQLDELIDLVEKGLVSVSEFENQRRKISEA